MKKLSYPYGIWMLVFILVPLLLVVFYAFTEINNDSLNFTLENFSRFFQKQYMDVLIISLELALKTTLLCLIIAYPLAYIISKENLFRRNLLIFLILIPMWMNFLLRSYAWLSILGRNGIINSIITFLGFEKLNLIYNEGSILLVMVYNYLPFMVLAIYSVLIKIDKTLIEAAEDLGANKRQIFTKLIFPLSIDGVITGIGMVFMPAMTSFVIPRLLGGGQYLFIGNLIEQEYLWVGDWHFGSSISIIMIFVIMINMAIAKKIGNKIGGKKLE